MIDALPGEQTGFEVWFRHGKTAVLHWDLYVNMTNLGEKIMAVGQVEPLFDPVSYDGHTWHIRLFKGSGLVQARVFNSEAEVRVYQSEGRNMEPDSYGPFIVAPGQKKTFVFSMLFDLLRDGIVAEMHPFPDQSKFATLLIGGAFNNGGEPRCGFRPLPLVVTLTDGRKIDARVTTMIGVVGCKIDLSCCKPGP